MACESTPERRLPGAAASPVPVAWLYISNNGDENQPAPVLRIGDAEFDDSGKYLFGIVP